MQEAIRPLNSLELRSESVSPVAQPDRKGLHASMPQAIQYAHRGAQGSWRVRFPILEWLVEEDHRACKGELARRVRK